MTHKGSDFERCLLLLQAALAAKILVKMLII